ncbi:HEAT repeat domain-containing protein [Tuwongella immobilis]|uniref:HEAT repeat domain-containing protein n=1 Tax=Tuwongella immobilis TaxID=692036 RepID=A0A6C2YGV9_9BACT|nr:HEAT repeat domain-containing protein [Tuwongella immobilis]VIP00726.1 hypothetical protein : : HEAT_2 [Tuwongella immobilis]VTR96870.1 hypothetical protein : : HEAT_2 [Tuwongella immobilis]
MQTTSAWRRRPSRITTWPVGIEALVLLSPTILLASLLGVVAPAQRTVLIVRLCITLLLALLGWTSVRGRIPLSGQVLFTSIPLLLWLETDRTTLGENTRMLVLGIAWLTPGLVLIGDVLGSSMLAHLRPAHRWTKMIVSRSQWPRTTVEIQQLPEVIGLREATIEDALPALHLLRDSRRPVQLAALAVLEGRSTWAPGQAELVLKYLESAEEPITRAAAIRALSWIDDPRVIDTMIHFLGDSLASVRLAALESLMTKPERRWPTIRQPIHVMLSDPRFSPDGPLPWSGPVLPPPVVVDLLHWSSEGNVIAPRATATLMRHYRQALTEGNAAMVLAELRMRVLDAKLAVIFRIDAAQLLRDYDALDQQLLEQMLKSGEPSPLRLLAVEILLSRDPHSNSVETLREIARQPNRELALQTAAIVQRYLKIDLGLPRNQPLPQLHTREAAEVTRRVMQWANDELHSPATSQTSLNSLGSLLIRPNPLLGGAAPGTPPRPTQASSQPEVPPDVRQTPSNPTPPPPPPKPDNNWNW